METPHYKFGKLPPKKDKRTLKLMDYLVPAALPQLPDYVHWQNKMPPDSGVMGNDHLNNCSVAAAGHLIVSWTANAFGQPAAVSGQAIDKTYANISGWDPQTNQGDNGAYCLDVLNYWRSTGIGGDFIEGYTILNVQDQRQVRYAIFLFGGAYSGLALPNYINPDPTIGTWDLYPGPPNPNTAPNPARGHTVPVIGYDSQFLYFVTWGRVLRMTWKFYFAYADEGYAVLSPMDWINQGHNPAGFDLATLRNNLTQIDNIA